MRRTPVVMIVALLVVSAACGDARHRATPSDGLSIFHSPVYGYVLRYPETWSVVEAAHRLEVGAPPATAFGGVDILGRDASTNVIQMAPPDVFIAAQPLSADANLDSWASEATHTVAFMKGCTTPDAHEEITVDGTAAVLFTYDHCPKELDLLHFWVAVVHGGTGFHIIWYDTSGRTPQDRASFQQLLASFSFGPPASSDQRDGYVSNADVACEKGRARLRSDPAESNSTAVLADMEQDLRALGAPPHALAVIGPDVPAALARVTWAAESFVAAGRYNLGDTIVTVTELRSLGFRVCGTR